MAAGEGFGDLADYWSEGLPLTIKGQTYVVPEPDAETGLYVQTLFSAGATVAGALQRGGSIDDVADDIKSMSRLDDDQETNLYLRLLGSAYDGMKANGVPWSMIRHAGMTAFVWIAVGSDAAKSHWQGIPLGQTASPSNRAERRAEGQPSTRTRAASAAKAASPSITKSPRTSSANSKGAASKSPGSKSSPAGNSSKPISTKPTGSTSATVKRSPRARGGG